MVGEDQPQFLLRRAERVIALADSLAEEILLQPRVAPGPLERRPDGPATVELERALVRLRVGGRSGVGVREVRLPCQRPDVAVVRARVRCGREPGPGILVERPTLDVLPHL